MGTFDQLCKTCAERGWALAMRMSACAADADDVMQDALTIAWKKQAAIPPVPWPWFCNVVVNCARNNRRKTNRIMLMEMSGDRAASAAGDSPERAAQKRETNTELLKAIKELPENEQRAIALCVLGGLSQAEASKATGVKLNTIKARVRRGLERLKQRFGDRPGGIEALLSVPVAVPANGTVDKAVERWTLKAKQGGATLTPASITVIVAGLLVVAASVLAGVTYLPRLWNDHKPLEPAVGPQTGSGGSLKNGDNNAPSVNSEQSDRAEGENDNSGSAGNTESTGVQPDQEGGADNAEGVPVAAADSPDGTEGWRLVPITMDYGNDTARPMARGTAMVKGAQSLTHGVMTLYYDNSNVMDRTEYRFGKRHGRAAVFYEDGTPKDVGAYFEDKEDGYWTLLYPSGSVNWTGNYRKGVQQGTWTSLHEDGSPQKSETYKDGLLDGERTERFKDGGTLVSNYLLGKRQGLETEIDTVKGTCRVSWYEDDKKHGNEFVFDLKTGDQLEWRRFNSGVEE